MATVVLTPEAQKQFHELPKAIRARMINVFARLADWPSVSGVRALTGNLAGWYRVRTGDYRLQFRVVDGVVQIHRIGNRDGFYE